MLTSHWKLEYNKNEPLIRNLSIESIESPLICILNSPNGKLFDVQHASSVALRPQNKWCFAWIYWNNFC